MTDRRKFLAHGAAILTGLRLPNLYAQAGLYDSVPVAEHLDPGMHLVRHAQKYADAHRDENIPPLLREEVLDSPSAVFAVRTSVSLQKDTSGRFPAENESFRREGRRVAKLLFRKGDRKGGQTLIQPNFVGGFSSDPRSVNNGISTHPAFVAGFGEQLRELGNTNIIIGANGAAKHEHFVQSGVAEMMHESGLFLYEGKYERWSDYEKPEVTWIDYPDGAVMRKVPFFRMVMDRDTTLINMAKDRIHQLGFTTLSIKNLQGTMPVGYMHICQPWHGDTGYSVRAAMKLQPDREIFNPDYQRVIEEGYLRHMGQKYKYWDEGGYAKMYFDQGGYAAYRRGENKPNEKLFWGEQWGQRMMDVAMNVKPYINMVEGIVGIDGANQLHLNNFVTLSRNMVSCDSLAAWLMGHDPRELPFLRIAKERGLGENDLDRVSVFEITDGGVSRIDYRNLPRAKMGVNVYGLRDMPLRFF